MKNIRNFAFICLCCFGNIRLIHRSISELQKDLKRRNKSVALLVMAERHSFVSVFLYQVPIRIQYLRSWTRGRISKINVGMLDFSDLIRHIDTSAWKSNTPPWLIDLIKSRNYKKYKNRGVNDNNQEITYLPAITTLSTH